MDAELGLIVDDGLDGIHAPRPLERRVEHGIGANMAPKEQMP